MRFSHVVVDGSNLATEGRSLPSLAQLDEAVRDFQREFPGVEITVVVDASFSHRIDEAERATFEEAEEAGEVVSPPAGAIGRGDAFLLRIAERVGATVLSNDSFQEFHGEHEWLFEPDRLIGGKPVPGVGWIFTPRTPVRGPKSRDAVREAKRGKVRIGSKEASQPMPVPKVPPPGKAARPPEVRPEPEPEVAASVPATTVRGRRNGPVRAAIAAATEEVVAPGSRSSEVDAELEDDAATRRRRRRRAAGPPPVAVNEPLPFIQFIADHPLGSVLEGEVESFTSHGAFVLAGGIRAYVPLAGLGNPPPRRARDVLTRGARVPFVLQALDPQRRGAELALPGFAEVAGRPSEETVDAEIGAEQRASRRRAAEPAASPEPAAAAEPAATAEAAVTAPAKPRRRTRATAQPEAAADPAATAEAAVTAPAKPRRRTRATAQPEAAAEPAAAAEAAVTAPAKPRRRTRATPPAAPAPEPSSTPAAEPTDATEAPPKPRRRTRTAPDPAPTSSSPTGADGPRAPRRRRGTASAAR